MQDDSARRCSARDARAMSTVALEAQPRDVREVVGGEDGTRIGVGGQRLRLGQKDEDFARADRRSRVQHVVTQNLTTVPEE